MANEFKHTDVGADLTKNEWEATTTHIADGQTSGDVLYFDGTYWKRKANLQTLKDADADTKVDVEEAGDEDMVRMDVGGTESFLLDANGVVTLAKQSSFGAIHNAAQSIPSSAWTHLTLPTESWDIQGEFDNSEKIGAADATEANKLHDADGGFAAGDVGKTVWNTTDNTYTTVSAYVDSGELTLTDNIMVNGEGYKLYFARFTATVAGKYTVFAKVTIDAAADGTRVLLGVYKNGTEAARLFDISGGGINYSPGGSSLVIDLAVNDYLDLRYYQSGVAKDTESGNTFRAIKVA